jgi:hypothetical protein
MNYNSFLNNIVLYPNPAKDLLFGLDLSASNTEIYNEQGQLMKIAKSNEQGFDVSHFTPGLYFIKKVNNENTAFRILNNKFDTRLLRYALTNPNISLNFFMLRIHRPSNPHRYN